MPPRRSRHLRLPQLGQSFQYDALGLRVQSFQGNAYAGDQTAESARPTERQGFDAQGRLLWKASALGMLHTWQYDTEGQLLQSARLSSTMAQRTTLSYDDLGRPIGTLHIEGSRTNYLGVEYIDIAPRNVGPVPDSGGNFTGRERIDRMWSYLVDEAEVTENETVMQIDIVGFSRGAAQAREFATRVATAESTRNGVSIIQYQAVDSSSGQLVTHCQRVNLRFMGLFETVLSTDLASGPKYRMDIPAQFEYVAHAVALNEHRSQPYSSDFFGYPLNARFWNSTRLNLTDDLHQGGFPLESIGASSRTPGQVRIELGFVGAHADVGGGYLDNNGLSLVALSWMVAQARAAGVNMLSPPSIDASASTPFHDQSNALRIGDPRTSPVVTRTVTDREGFTYTQEEQLIAEDRQVRKAVSGNTQRTMGFGNNSLTTAGTYEFITYNPRTVGDYKEVESNITGTVDLQRYIKWLREHGYCFADDACDDLPTQ